MFDTILIIALIGTLAVFALPTRTEAAPEADTDSRTEVQQIIAMLEAGQTGGMATMPEVL